MSQASSEPAALALTADDVAAIPATPLAESIPGVEHRIVWRTARSMAGVMTIAAGQRLGSHRHRQHHHHLWVIDGEAEVLGARLGAGSYAHVPFGVDHDLDATSTAGCTVFYVYEVAADDHRHDVRADG